MRSVLIPHPDTPGPDIRISVEADRKPNGVLALAYIVTGETARIVRPAHVIPPGRADELWTTTCFEAFITVPGAQAYVEINLSPSLNWAAYRFDGYRAGMAPLEIAAPPILAPKEGETIFLGAEIALGEVADLSPDGAWRLGLSAVIEETSGRKSYWALAHAAGKPDFHHPDGLVLDLPPA
ncbi:MAG: DOMON-like domain-containing protein [Hyphomonadaceae bacterium]